MCVCPKKILENFSVKSAALGLAHKKEKTLKAQMNE